LAALTSDVASLSIVLACVCRPLIPLLEATLGRFLIEFSRLVRSDQYAGLLLRQPARAISATAVSIAISVGVPTRASLGRCPDLRSGALAISREPSTLRSGWSARALSTSSPDDAPPSQEFREVEPSAGPDIAPLGAKRVEERRSGRLATADADLPPLSYGISSATPRALLGAGNGPVADGLLAGELASGWAKAAVCAGETRARLALLDRSTTGSERPAYVEGGRC
jgi:hypothetical protein